MNDRRLVVRLVGSMVTLAGALVWLARLGRGRLSAPPLSFDEAASWLEQRDTVTAAFALMRLLAMGFGGYLLLVVVVGSVARMCRLARVTVVVDRCTLPFVRALFGGVALLGAIAAPPSLPSQPHDTMVELPPVSPASDGYATLHLLPEAPTTTSTSTTSPVAVAPTTPVTTTTPAIPPDAPAPQPAIDVSDTWVVQHGESFWSIAQTHLEEVHGDHVSPRTVDAYWRELIELNRSRLVSGDPDVLYRGQEIELPAVVIG